MAESAGRARIQRGAILGNAISGVAQVPRQIMADQANQRKERLAEMRAQATASYQRAESNRADAQAQRQAVLDQQTLTKLQQEETDRTDTAAGIAAYVGGTPNDSATNDPKAGIAELMRRGRADLIPTFQKFHESQQPKIGEAAAGTAGRYLTGPQAGSLVPNSQVPKEPAPVTGPQLDQAAQLLYAKKNSGAPLSADETNTLRGYEDRKRVISDPAQQAATDRQTNTIAAQVAQQKRSQDFTEAQAGRAALLKDATQPYLDAKEKADTMRSVIEAARGGNMTAANVQTLMGTLGVVTTEGVKRINTTELQAVGGAGSLLERIKGHAYKIISGQPLSPKIQADLEQLATLLEQGARKKYESSHQAISKSYRLTEPMIADPSAAPSSTATGTGLTYQDYLKKKGGA